MATGSPTKDRSASLKVTKSRSPSAYMEVVLIAQKLDPRHGSQRAAFPLGMRTCSVRTDGRRRRRAGIVGKIERGTS